MRLRDPKTIIRNLFNKYAKIDGNVVHAEKMFIINSVIKYLFENDAKKIDKEEIALYGDIIDKYLKNEVDILWEDGKLVVTDPKTGGK